MSPKKLWSIRWKALRRQRRSTGIHYPQGLVKKEAVRLVEGLNKRSPDYYLYRIVPAVVQDEEE